MCWVAVRWVILGKGLSSENWKDSRDGMNAPVAVLNTRKEKVQSLWTTAPYACAFGSPTLLLLFAEEGEEGDCTTTTIATSRNKRQSATNNQQKSERKKKNLWGCFWAKPKGKKQRGGLLASKKNQKTSFNTKPTTTNLTFLWLKRCANKPNTGKVADVFDEKWGGGWWAGEQCETKQGKPLRDLLPGCKQTKMGHKRKKENGRTGRTGRTGERKTRGGVRGRSGLHAGFGCGCFTCNGCNWCNGG